MDEVSKAGYRLNLVWNNGKEAWSYFMGPTFGKTLITMGGFHITTLQVAYYSHPCTNISLVALILF